MNKLSPFLLLIYIFIGCSEKETSTGREAGRNDKAFQVFEAAKSVTELDKKLILLSEAANEINSPNDTLLIDIIDHQIFYHDVKKSFDSSLYYANLMIDYGLEVGDTATIAKGFYRRGRSHLYQGDNLKVLHDMYQSQKYYLLVGDSLNAGKRLVEQGIAQYRLGDFVGNQSTQIEALKLLGNSGDSIFLARIFNNLAISYRQLKDFDEAIDEYSMASKFVSSRKDSLSIINNIANTYTEKGDYIRSLKIFDSILPLAKEIEPLNRIKDNYFFTLWLDSKANVEDSLKSILKSRREENDLIGMLFSLDHLTVVTMEKDKAEALRYAEEYLRKAQRLNSVSDEIRALGYLIQLSPPGENKQYFVEYMHLNDSLISARDKVKNYFAKIKYDEKQKLEEIFDLEKLNSNQKLKILQEQNRRNLAISAGLLLLAAALFLYYFLQQRHKKDMVRKIHNTEASISKRIHDELANDVFNVMTELENSKKVNWERTLNKLDSIYERTRNISRANTAIATGPDYKDHLHYILSQNTPENVKLYLVGFNDIIWQRINKESKIIIYRSLQELMVNMNKHSKASIVGLNFRQTGSKLRITYTDDGVGFSPNQLKNGSGLENVENRIVSIGGVFNFKPGMDKGFSANILIPL